MVEVLGGAKKIRDFFWSQRLSKVLIFDYFGQNTRVGFSSEKSDPQNFHIMIVLAKVCFLETENHVVSKDFKIFCP